MEQIEAEEEVLKKRLETRMKKIEERLRYIIGHIVSCTWAHSNFELESVRLNAR
jgi:hypothetical protein